MIYANLNERQEAWRWLEIGYQERSAQMVYIRVDPRFDNLRSDPRFDDLLRRMNYPSHPGRTVPSHGSSVNS
jgi:hypothetical protein